MQYEFYGEPQILHFKFYGIINFYYFCVENVAIMEYGIFKRKIYDKLIDWKQRKNGSTALLIKGARRVGKSTISEEFAKREYKTYIAIDFVKAPTEVKELFRDLDDLNYIFLRLQSIYGVRLYERQSVIIFDEVQKCPEARQAIKYLVADGRYDYIETGSLLFIRKNTMGIVIPSEETGIDMYPMDFEEFLWAMGDETSMPLIRYAFDKLKPLGDVAHRALLRKFRLYMLVGGMPQAVNEYLDTNNFEDVDQVKREIIQLYINDLRKIDETWNASRIYESIPAELSRNKLRYEPGGILKTERNRLQDVWIDLEDSLTVNFSYRCTDPNVGMSLHKDYNSFRIFTGDTGLFVTLAFSDKSATENIIYNKLLTDSLSADLGYIYENVVAQSLKAAGHSLFYYTFPADEERKNYYEIDFMLSKGTKVIPIEVKSSGYKTHKSIDVFCEKYSSRVGRPVMLYTKDLKTEGNMLYLPVYMTSLL